MRVSGVKKIVVLTFLAFAFLSHAAAAEPPRFAVVVNAKNTAAKADHALVRLLYLKDLSEWPDGTPAKPIGRPDESAEHHAFLDQVLKLKPWRLAEHWIALKQKNGSGKVRAVSKDNQVAMLVNRYPGAFGVLPLEVAENDSSLRILLKLH